MQKIKIYNTLSGKKEEIKPISGKKINLFVCGPTVYDFSHLGHARSYVIFDAFAKYLKAAGYNVYYLQNITDIDDKIIARAKERGVTPKDLAEAFTSEYFKDMEALGVTSVKKYAKATDHIKEIIDQVLRLMDKKYAYPLEDGIYFDISKFKNYGKLSHRTVLDAEDSVTRIDYSKNKRNRGDFCLWKFSMPGEPSWTAPFGNGRPGWHIEDTAITETYLGDQYDIHGGGRDLIFPHHEAEVTQMEAVSGKRPLARYWMHTGFLTINGQKMSKSLDNFILINDFLKRYQSEQLRFWIVRNLWRTPMDYSENAMIEAKISLEKIEELLRKLKTLKVAKSTNPGAVKKIFDSAKKGFYEDLADDFNTPKAFATLFEFMKEVNKTLETGELGKKEARDIYKFFEEINKIFGIINFESVKSSNIPEEVMDLVKLREQHRKDTHWQKADEVRTEIEKYGYSVDDTPQGPVVKKIH
jgi:cysteinyl-tRNA synthetase